MNYIYDIIINLNKKYYDFFEWNQNDSLCHIRKIPIIRINNNDFMNLLTNKIIIDNKVLNIIKDKTDVFNNINDNIKYCCLFTDTNEVLAISFDENGNSMLKSDLLIEEALDVLEISLHIRESNIKYNILNNELDNCFLTRNTQKTKHRILKKIDNISKKETEKMKYLYYECFNEEEKDYKKMVSKIKKNISNEDVLKKLNNFFKLISNYR